MSDIETSFNSYYQKADRNTRIVLANYSLSTIRLIAQDTFKAIPLLLEIDPLATVKGVLNGRLIALNDKENKRYSFFVHTNKWEQATSYNLPEFSSYEDINTFLEIYKTLELDTRSKDELNNFKPDIEDPNSISEIIKDSVSYYTLSEKERLLVNSVISSMQPFVDLSSKYTKEISKFYLQTHLDYSDQLKSHTEKLLNSLKK